MGWPALTLTGDGYGAVDVRQVHLAQLVTVDAHRHEPECG